MNDHNYYYAQTPRIIDLGDASIAVREYGQGKPLVFIHGFFVMGYTWRKLLPTLAERFTCYVVDLPGFGDSIYTKDTDFSFTAQTRRLNQLFQILGIADYFSIVAHDTGASIARMVALEKANQVEKLVLINTEIPDHRPPFIPMYQFLAKLPFANVAFRSLLKSDAIIRSPLLINQFFYDKSKLRDKRNYQHYVLPLKDSKRMFGLLGYLKGIEWEVVDDFQKNHRLIRAETLLLWGAEDRTFPIKRAEQMVPQFNGNCKLVAIPKTCIMPHEEKPEAVLVALRDFLG